MNQLPLRMSRSKRLAGAAVAVMAAGLWWVPQPASAAPTTAGPRLVNIGVDHADPANQQPQKGRLFEYTDFFSRSISVHRGEVVDFQTTPFAFHVVAVARDEAKARAVYPIAFNDRDEHGAPSGKPKIGFGPSNFPIVDGSTSNPASGQVDFTRPNGPPVCGATGEANCVFTGGNQVQVAGPNVSFTGPADWKVTINAPVGVYHFFCYIHPHMSGVLHVVGRDHWATTQTDITEDSARQFAASRRQALDVESDLNRIRHSADAPGHRTFWIRVGAAAADNHVAIDEIFPNPQTTGPLQLDRGDRVVYLWDDPHNVHSIFFPARPPTFSNDVGPFGFDCAAGYVPAGSAPPCSETHEHGLTSPPFNPPFELIADPGNAPPGTVVARRTQLIDSGIRVGTGYGLDPSSQFWSVRTDSSTATGAAPYLFHCTVHDFMVGAFVVHP
jgi:hypothetical protein